MLQISYYAAITDLLYYEVLAVSLAEMENKRSLKIHFIRPANENEVKWN